MTAESAPTTRPVSRKRKAGLLSSSAEFSLPEGHNLEIGGVRGYPIDFTVKAATSEWPPRLIRDFDEPHWLDIFQLGLGYYERYLDEGDERWLDAALKAGEHTLEGQERGGRLDGAWRHYERFPHTFRMGIPWMSAMAQGEGASFFVRLYLETREERWADAARRALRPMAAPTDQGGVHALLDGRPFPEEYPTTPPSFVLNGGIFALWGLHDVGTGLGDVEAARSFVEGADTLADQIHRWDTGHWSRYDLFPHPVVNVASSFYHDLHINQLCAMHRMHERRELAEAAERFRGYAASRARRGVAFGRKVLFRVAVPRSQKLARRLPWAEPV